MNPTISLFVSISLFFFFHVHACTNITKILNQFPEFAAFNDYLTRTGVAYEIDSRSAVTILVFNNIVASKLASLPENSIRTTLRVHVILDYYNTRKLENIPGRSVAVTTLFQNTGNAIGGEGYLNVTVLGKGTIAIGSAVPGAPLNANLVRPVILQPYTISVMQVSNVIVPLGDPTNIPNSGPTQSPTNSLPPSSVPAAAPGATILPPSTPLMPARAPTPRRALAPSPIPVNSQPPSPIPMYPGSEKDQSPPSTSAPSSSESPILPPPAHAPIHIFDALPIPPSGGKQSSACRIHWFRVTVMVITVATSFVVL